MSVHNSMKTSVQWKTPWSHWEPNRRKDGLGTRRVTTVCVFAFGVCREGLFFSIFFTMPSAPQQKKACIVRTCEPLVNDHCVEALMTIPFELPTLLFFHGLKSYSVRQGKQERNGHFLAGQLCETRLPSCFVCDGLWRSETLDRTEEECKSSARWTADWAGPRYVDIYVLYGILRFWQWHCSRYITGQLTVSMTLASIHYKLTMLSDDIECTTILALK